MISETQFYKEENFKVVEADGFKLEIPEDWEVVRLGDVTDEIYYGVTAKAVEHNTDLRILRTTDIKDYSADWNNLPYCEITENRNDLKKYFLKKGDIIIARAGTVGVSVLVERDFEDVVFGSYLIKVKLKPVILPKFAHYYLQTSIYWNHITKAQGSTLKNINLPLLKSLLITLPPLPEQQKIAHVLMSIDKAIEAVDEAIKQAERIKKGLMQELLTKGVTFGFMFDTNVFNRILDGDVDINLLPKKLKYYVTHNQRDEIERTPDNRRKKKLLKIFKAIEQERIPTETTLWGMSPWGESKWRAYGGLYDKLLARIQKLDKEAGKKKSLKNQIRDALIAETCILNQLVLVSEDKNLRKVVKEFKGVVISFEQFLKGEYREFKDTEIGRIPKEWEVVRLGDVAEINKESINPPKEAPDKEFYYIEIDSIQDGKIKSVKKIIGKNAPSRARRLVRENDVIMSTVRPYLRAFALVPKKYDGQICSTGFAVLRCKKNLTTPKYLLYNLFMDRTIEQCNRLMVGGQYPALNQSHVERLKIPLPPLQEQQKIAEILSKWDEVIELKRAKKEKLERMKKKVMELLLTGKVRIK